MTERRFWLVELREVRGLSQVDLAETLGVDTGTISRWERGGQRIRAANLRRLATALEVPLATLHLVATARMPDTAAVLADLAGAPLSRPEWLALARPVAPVLGEFADVEQLEAIQDHIRSLVTLDNRFGGADLVNFSAQYFNDLRDQIGTGAYNPNLARDFHAALGELAEVVGWLAYDAELHDLVHRMNQEALFHSRLAGDRTMELLTLQNVSMHAGALHRPAEALTVARYVLESSDELSARVRCLFLLRKARAMAQAGDHSALAIFDEARDVYLKGVSDSDPAWAWWVDERQLAWHEGMAKRDLNLLGPALESFEQAYEAGNGHEVRSNYIHTAYLLQAQVDVGAWPDATASITAVLPLIPQVRSPRGVVVLNNTLAAAADRGHTDDEFDEHLIRLHQALASARG